MPSATFRLQLKNATVISMEEVSAVRIASNTLAEQERDARVLDALVVVVPMAVAAERKAAFCRVELHRGNAKVEHDAVRAVMQKRRREVWRRLRSMGGLPAGTSPTLAQRTTGANNDVSPAA